MRYAKFPLVLLVALVLAGCTLFPEREPVERAWYLLELPPEPAPRVAGAPLAVELASVRVAPAYAGSGLVYRLGDHRYESDYYHEWFLPPARHLEQLLRERWGRPGSAIELVDNAEAERARGRPALRLDVLVTALYGDLDEAQPAHAVTVRGTGHFALRSRVEGAAAPRLIELDAEQAIERRSASRLVAALSAAAAQVLVELEDELLRAAADAEDA